MGWILALALLLSPGVAVAQCTAFWGSVVNVVTTDGHLHPANAETNHNQDPAEVATTCTRDNLPTSCDGDETLAHSYGTQTFVLDQCKNDAGLDTCQLSHHDAFSSPDVQIGLDWQTLTNTDFTTFWLEVIDRDTRGWPCPLGEHVDCTAGFTLNEWAFLEEEVTKYNLENSGFMGLVGYESSAALGKCSEDKTDSCTLDSECSGTCELDSESTTGSHGHKTVFCAPDPKAGVDATLPPGVCTIRDHLNRDACTSMRDLFVDAVENNCVITQAHPCTSSGGGGWTLPGTVEPDAYTSDLIRLFEVGAGGQFFDDTANCVEAFANVDINMLEVFKRGFFVGPMSATDFHHVPPNDGTTVCSNCLSAGERSRTNVWATGLTQYEVIQAMKERRTCWVRDSGITCYSEAYDEPTGGACGKPDVPMGRRDWRLIDGDFSLRWRCDSTGSSANIDNWVVHAVRVIGGAATSEEIASGSTGCSGGVCEHELEFTENIDGVYLVECKEGSTRKTLAAPIGVNHDLFRDKIGWNQPPL